MNKYLEEDLRSIKRFQEFCERQRQAEAERGNNGWIEKKDDGQDRKSKKPTRIKLKGNQNEKI